MCFHITSLVIHINTLHSIHWYSIFFCIHYTRFFITRTFLFQYVFLLLLSFDAKAKLHSLHLNIICVTFVARFASSSSSFINTFFLHSKSSDYAHFIVCYSFSRESHQVSLGAQTLSFICCVIVFGCVCEFTFALVSNFNLVLFLHLVRNNVSSD